MARVTVEDCVVKVPNRFELVLMAANRARAVSSGEPITIERDNDKNPVIALREIADSTVDTERLRNNLIQGLQKHVEMDEPEEDTLAMSLPTVGWGEGDEVAARSREDYDEEAPDEAQSADDLGSDEDTAAAD